MIKKLCFLIALAAVVSAYGSDVVDFSQFGLSHNSEIDTPLEAGNCILSFSGETQGVIYKRSGMVEMPEGTSVTVTAQSGRIKKIIFKFYSVGSFTADTGTYDSATNSWTGEASSVTFTCTNTGPSATYVTSMLVIYDSDLTEKDAYVVKTEYMGDVDLGDDHYAKRLTFYYDSGKPEWIFTKGMDAVFDLPQKNGYPEWNVMTDENLPIDLVVFDKSFADFRPVSTASWFEDIPIRKVEGMEYLNTSLTTDMEMMFVGCHYLKSIDLSHFDTSSSDNLNYLFADCSSLESLDLSAFTVNGSTHGLLKNCVALRTLVVSGTVSTLSDDACIGVGTEDKPCVIMPPEDFDFGTATEGTFLWKGGYFSLEPTAVLSASQDGLVRGGRGTLDIFMTNGNAVFNGFQMDITLPQGISLVPQGDTYIYTLGERYSGEGMEIVIRQLEDCHYRLMGYSLNNVAVTGNSGLLFSLTLQADSELQGGIYEGHVSDASLSAEGKVTVDASDVDFNIDVSQFLLGDVDHDWRVNVVDVMMIINHVLGNYDYNYHNENADMNYDGNVNVLDITDLIYYILDNMR